MNKGLFVNVTFAERVTRTVVAIGLLLDALLTPVIPEVFFPLLFLAQYLFFTALVSWDPVYGFIYKVSKLLKRLILRKSEDIALLV